MDCEHAREEFVERLTGALDADRSGVLDQHLAGCAACRAETDRLRELWTELGALRVAPSRASEHVARLIDARARAATSAAVRGVGGTLVSRVAIAALAAAASLLVGVGVGRRSATPPTATSKERYVLLLHGPARPAAADAKQAAADSVAEQAIVSEYRAWAMRLRDSGALVMAEKLARDPVTMLSAAGATELPHDTPDEVGGFFLIQADSAEAFRIARECPHLRHGGTVQVRRIQPT